MNRQRSLLLTRVLLITSVVLLLSSLILFSLTLILPPLHAKRASQLADILQELMPSATDGIPEERYDPTVSTVEVDGIDFCGILDIPKYGRQLPVHAQWNTNRLSNYPCRYTGSIYENGMIIGGSDHSGQLDFMKQIQNGDTIYFTDVTGLRCSYTVTSILRTNDVSSSYLIDERSDLTLFVRNSYGLDYIVVRCVNQTSS